MLEQEIASIMNYVLINANTATPYYDEVPEDFMVPAVYFPSPEIESGGDTLSTYSLKYIWFIKFFHSSTPAAYQMALSVLEIIKRKRNIIPVINEAGEFTGENFKVKDPKLKKIDGAAGAVQLTIIWDSLRPYENPVYTKMDSYGLDMYSRTAYESAVKQIGGEDVEEKS